ncbi:sensor histidine kinase [Bdellovibrio sp.]|uniref:sensor histidine kinase n=1 Tax=Bdellovibrio sp. TaxID=28201 RepID=UPI0039E2B8A0
MPVTLVLGIIQGVFYFLQTTQAQTSAQAIQALLRQELSSSNTFLISRTLSDLRESGLIKCVKLVELKTGQVHLDLRFKDKCGGAFWLLEGKVVNADFKSLNGAQWRVDFESVNGRFFEISLWLARILFSGLMLAGVALFYRREDKYKKEELKKEKLKELAAQAAHDVASPLTLLNALVGSDIISTEAKQIVGLIGERVQGIVGNLKNQTVQIEGDERQSFLSVDLIACLEIALREAKSRYANIEWNPPGIPVMVKADRDDLIRVISNILNNAIEASWKSQKTISLGISDYDCVTLSVQDGGVGIAADVLHRLGEKGVTHGKQSGKGLGLYHAKSCLSQWGGTLSIDSRQGDGTTITLVFLK